MHAACKGCAYVVCIHVVCVYLVCMHVVYKVVCMCMLWGACVCPLLCSEPTAAIWRAGPMLGGTLSQMGCEYSKFLHQSEVRRVHSCGLQRKTDSLHSPPVTAGRHLPAYQSWGEEGLMEGRAGAAVRGAHLPLPSVPPSGKV